MLSTTHRAYATHPATRPLSLALLAGVLALASLGSSPALGSDPAAASLPAAAPVQKASPEKQDVTTQARPASNPDAIAAPAAEGDRAETPSGLAAKSPEAHADGPAIEPEGVDPVRQGSRPAACGPVTFQDCCFRTVPPDCAFLCKYDKFASTCTPGVTICKAMNVTPGAQSTSHPYFSTRTSTGKYLGYSLTCTSVQ